MLKKILMGVAILVGSAMAQAQDPVVDFQGDIALTMKSLTKAHAYQKVGAEGVFRHGFLVSTSAGHLNLKFKDMSIPRTLEVEFFSNGLAEEDGAWNACGQQTLDAIAEGKDLQVNINDLDKAKLDQIVKAKIVLKKDSQGNPMAKRIVRLKIDVNSDLDFSCSAQ